MEKRLPDLPNLDADASIPEQLRVIAEWVENSPDVPFTMAVAFIWAGKGNYWVQGYGPHNPAFAEIVRNFFNGILQRGIARFSPEKTKETSLN